MPVEVRTLISAAAVIVVAGCSAPVPPGPPSPATYPRTRPELSNYRETSRYSDVRRFLDSLRALRAPLAFGSIGKTNEGREIPYVIASRPLVALHRSPALGLPIVYVRGNPRGKSRKGGAAGLIRDLSFAGHRMLSSIVSTGADLHRRRTRALCITTLSTAERPGMVAFAPTRRARLERDY